jgi:hypothetical protein
MCLIAVLERYMSSTNIKKDEDEDDELANSPVIFQTKVKAKPSPFISKEMLQKETQKPQKPQRQMNDRHKNGKQELKDEVIKKNEKMKLKEDDKLTLRN